MAVRIDASADRLERTSAVINHNAAYTFMGWFYFTSLPTTRASNALALNNASTGNDNTDYFQIDAAATHHAEWGLSIAGAFSYVSGSTVISTGTWYHIAMVRAAANSLQCYINGVAEGAAITTDCAGRTGAGFMYVGSESPGIGNWMDGRCAYIKAWTRGLSAAEVLDEMRAIRPVHPLTLWGWWPVWPNQRVKDLSGNARDWTESGTLTDEDPPNTPYGAPEWLIIPAAPAGAGTQTLLPSAIASLEAFGTAKLNLRLLLTGIASAEAFGTTKLNKRISPTAITTAEAFGVAKLNLRLLLTGIISGEAFGVTTVKATQIVLPGSIASLEAFGVAKLNLRLLMNAIVSQEAFGTTKLNLRLLVNAITSLEAFGTTKLNLRLLINAIISLEAFGSTTLKQAQAILPGGITSGQAFGTAKLNLRLLIQAIASAEGFGTTQILLTGAIQPTGIASAEAFGTAKLNLRLTMQGIPSAQAFGTTTLDVLQTLLPGSIVSGEVFGTPKLNYRIISVGIASAQAFGLPVLVVSSTQTLLLSGIPSGEAFGIATIVLVLQPLLASTYEADWILDQVPVLATDVDATQWVDRSDWTVLEFQQTAATGHSGTSDEDI